MSPSIWVYDIETTPNLVYAWGLWDQNIGISQIVQPQDILSFAAHKIGTKGIEAHASWNDRGAMVQRLHDIMEDADYLVGYNHIGFDNKLVRAAFVKEKLGPPSPFRNVDLLKVVKKQFKFPSHKLDYVCHALDLDVKADTGGMELWTKSMNGDVAAQRKMLRYNKQDVKITTQLFHRLLPYIDGLNVPIYGGESEQPLCTRCASDQIHSRGFAYTTTYRYRRFQCQACQGWMRSAKSEPLRTDLRNA